MDEQEIHGAPKDRTDARDSAAQESDRRLHSVAYTSLANLLRGNSGLRSPLVASDPSLANRDASDLSCFQWLMNKIRRAAPTPLPAPTLLPAPAAPEAPHAPAMSSLATPPSPTSPPTVIGGYGTVLTVLAFFGGSGVLAYIPTINPSNNVYPGLTLTISGIGLLFTMTGFLHIFCARSICSYISMSTCTIGVIACCSVLICIKLLGLEGLTPLMCAGIWSGGALALGICIGFYTCLLINQDMITPVINKE